MNSNIVTRVGFLLIMTTCVATPVGAQWLTYPTAGVPRLADGSPNLRAATPRTPDGKPDFSGIWEPDMNRPCPPDGCADMKVPQEFVNIGWGLQGGAPYQPWAAQARRERMEQQGKDDPVSRCVPGGLVKLHTTPQLRKVIQVPGLVVTLNEMDASYRQIFTDGRPLPPVVEIPSFKGFSVGTWDGDALVVHTIGFPDGVWLDRSGSPLTDAARITERWRRLDYGTMEIDITVDDAKAYTRPWTVTLTHRLVLDTDLIDYICTENEKDFSAGRLIGK